MNREITTKKIRKQKKFTNPCPVIKGGSTDNGRKPKVYYLPMV